MSIFKQILIAGLFLQCSVSLFAQQDPMYTQYLNNMVSVNPAYAGSRGTFNVLALNRIQWVGIEGAPQTMTLSINSPFNKYKVGLGFNLIYDVIGPLKQTGLYADYAYHLKINRNTKLAFGLKGGFNLFDANLTGLLGADHDNHVALYGDRKMFLPNFGVGTYLYSDHYYLGLSVPKLLTNSLTEDENTLQYVNEEERHYFLMGGLLMDVSDYIRFKPSFMTRVVSGSPASIELTGTFIFFDTFWLGGMYRFGDSVGGFVQFQISPQIKLGYAYDLTQSKLRNYNNGTHEVLVSYDLAFSRKKILSPRFF